MLERSFTLDVLKVMAAQLIVWHHFSAYGPMSDTMTLVWPQLMEWLYRNARLAVQIFLVIGGYLAAQAAMNAPTTQPMRQIAKRYLRLVPFYVLALSVICIISLFLQNIIHADWLPNAPTFGQFFAHAFLLHDWLGFEALSSGVWYIAIDFQLYVLLIVLCYLFQSHPRHLSMAVAVLSIASMWQFNRVDALETYAIYFFAAYGLGVLAAWAQRSSLDMRVFWFTALLAVASLWVEFRTRLSVALLTAVWLVIQPKHLIQGTSVKPWVRRLSNSAYVLFLTHFGVIVVFSALWNLCRFYDPYIAFAMTTLAWIVCVGLALVLHEKVEVPLHHWVSHQSKRMLQALAWAHAQLQAKSALTIENA